MTDQPARLLAPADRAGAVLEPAHAALAGRLLNGYRLVAGGSPHRLIEAETYLHSVDHPDPFAHRDPIQLHPGRWYFHRTGGAYRGGSFKGVDVTFGGGTAYGGVLLRGLELPDGTVIDGPSLVVDHLLKATGFPTVAALDAAIGGRLVWDAASPLALAPWAGDPRPVWRSVRVGLSLKKRAFTPDDPTLSYLFRPDRFLTDPLRTKKGKPHLVLPLLADGVEAAEASRLTGCPVSAVKRYAAAFAAGREEGTAEPYYGTALSTAALCRLYGWWRERRGV